MSRLFSYSLGPEGRGVCRPSSSAALFAEQDGITLRRCCACTIEVLGAERWGRRYCRNSFCLPSCRMSYEYTHQRPALAADVVLLGLSDGRLHLLLVQRGIEPFKRGWCLPGGHVDAGENVTAAASRELKEETGIEIETLRQVATFADAGRDPRGWTASVIHLGVTLTSKAQPVAADDAVAAAWFPLTELPPLAFDHAKIVAFVLHNLGHLPPLWPERSSASAIVGTPDREHLEPDLIQQDLDAALSETPSHHTVNETARVLTEWLRYP